MDTRFLLMARYDALPIIPIDKVRLDFFNHLSLPKFLRKLNEHSIAVPVVRAEQSQKSQRGVHVEDLAHFSDDRRLSAKREFEQFHQ